ncbi:MAG TPA: hypothetical protein VFE77_00070 [Rhodanobacter sp.]|nr:hypothetical protein [Rhodanobacter sp.]
MNDTAAQSDDTVTLDPENPWLGLFSYTEENRAYFHGRDEEAAELARRVQRKLLTVLFGQSGLGKTSLLRAGLVPRLHGEGYCPVYVRIDYAAGSPSPSAQIKQAVFRATAAAGHWTQPGASVEGESLWEFLHHRGDLLRDAAGHTLTPLLIFDQFEEIFTLGQADDAGRSRARQFLEDLADLVENRPPAALEKRLEEDDSVVEQFDFARADYRVLITLREDYLAHLESVKDSMPSITQNRMRLARMHGAQALSAVLGPGRKLVSQEVAESIVRFVAGGSELIHAEIEPSLLSLVCRELNTTRKAQGRKEISADLLAGSRDTILSEFYERALADQPAGVRRVIEDELLTESGYRESLAEERVLKALAAAGAMPDALAKLVNHRLLRIEDRLDMRRVELTHDVLCSVVLASRNQRHAREAREEAGRQLAAQQEREAATHRALKRTRRLVDVFAVLLVLAAASAVFGFVNLHRAHVAEAEAQHSRSNAEKLVSFLIEDFYSELEPTGRLETLGKLAHMTVGYYDSLPPKLVTSQTQINRAMALVREGASQQSSGNRDAGARSFGEAQSVFEKLRASGNHSEAVTYGLALALQSQGSSIVGATGAGRGTGAQLQQAADLLRPLVYAPHPTRRVRQLYADTLNYLTVTQSLEPSLATCDEARKILMGLGALNLTDLTAASSYADAADTEARRLLTLGRIAEAQKLERQVYDLAEKVLERRPGDLHALSDRSWAAELIGTLADRQHDDATAAEYANRTVQAGEDEVRFNPSDLSGWQRWTTGMRQVADRQFERGEVTSTIGTMRSLLALENDKRLPSSLGPIVWFQWLSLASLQAQTGDSPAAAQSLKNFVRDAGEVVAPLAADDARRKLLVNPGQSLEATLQLTEGASQSAFANASEVINRIDAVKAPRGTNGFLLKRNMLNGMLATASMAALRLGHYAQAEALARRWLALPGNPTSEADARNGTSRARSTLANAIAMQGRNDQAQQALQPALTYYEGEQKAGADGTAFRNDYAYALYVSAIAAPGDGAGRKQRDAALTQAAGLIAGASKEAQQLADMRNTASLIAAARATPAG